MSDVLDLDWELLCHLAKPESFNALLTEQFSTELIEEDAVEKVFAWQLEHVRQHHQPASQKVLEEQFNQPLEEPETAIGDLIGRLRERYIRNESQEVYEEIARATVHDPLSVPKRFLEEGRRLNDKTATRGESFGSEDFDLAMTVYDKKVTQGRGPSLGFPEIDDHFHGMQGLSFLIAAPKTYKSWVAVNAVQSNIHYGSFPYLYSLELPAHDFRWRLFCMEANVPYWKYLKGQLSEDDRKALKQSSEDLFGWGNFRIEKPQPGERSVTQLIEKAVNAGADSIFIDQLQYVESVRGSSLGALNDTGAYFEACNELRDYSDSIPIFVVHQFNRSAMNADSMPEMQQAKGSSAIEETATLGIGLYSNKDMRSSNILELGTLLSRHFTWPSWEVGVELSRGCAFTLNGEVTDAGP